MHPYIRLLLTFFIAAAPSWAAGTLDMAAAVLGTTLATAHPNQQEQEETTKNDEDHG